MLKSLCVFFFLYSPLSLGLIQYRPIHSPEKHELSLGIIVKHSKNTALSYDSHFFNYGRYFSEINSLLPKPWNNIFLLGLSLGAKILKNSSYQNSCSSESHPFFYHAGGKFKLSYFEILRPFVEYGWVQAACVKNLTLDSSLKDFEYSKGTLQLKQYFALGLDLSFKFLDKKSIYSLDQDYGLNDIGMRGQCFKYLQKDKTSFLSCEIGLNFLF